ncbi:hypothetical protein CANARDRAFT_109540 [[Candida] arabinofermentans NRRL YB-2248]|uniref:Structure-specific endonuclease subunit SLX4 n=1 Tax=[Candida] arabinofermentans NRRL YB-2248 TaxID=983967 RepID=A0A1E4STF9_9ASCO|nr:hypothetical protein CANARDRAFT_109540 [[Candida] arabinofermentans NRRL YB-2248]
MDPITLSEETEGSTGFCFGTQAQGNIEEWHIHDQKRSTLSKLSSQFSLEANGQTDKESRMMVRKRRSPAVSKGAVQAKKSKAKTLTGQMTTKYGKCQSISVLLALSGKKHKFKDIIKRVGAIETSNFVEDSQVAENDCGKAEDISILYSKAEWDSVLKVIDKSFPKLSKPTRRTLDFVSKMYSQQAQNTCKSLKLWGESSLPSLVLSEADVQALYDFKSHDRSFLDSSSDDGEVEYNMVQTLSQVIENSRMASRTGSTLVSRNVGENTVREENEEKEEKEAEGSFKISSGVDEINASVDEDYHSPINWNTIEGLEGRLASSTRPIIVKSLSEGSVDEDSLMLVSVSSLLPADPHTIEQVDDLLGYSGDQNEESSIKEISQMDFDTVPTRQGTQIDPVMVSSSQNDGNSIRDGPIDLPISINSTRAEIQVLESVNQNNAQLTSFAYHPQFPRNQFRSPVKDLDLKTDKAEVITSSPASFPDSKRGTKVPLTQELDSSPLGSPLLSDIRPAIQSRTSINQLPDEFNASSSSTQKCRKQTSLNFSQSKKRSTDDGAIEIISESEDEDGLNSANDLKAGKGRLFDKIFGTANSQFEQLFEILNSSSDDENYNKGAEKPRETIRSNNTVPFDKPESAEMAYSRPAEHSEEIESSYDQSVVPESDNLLNEESSIIQVPSSQSSNKETAVYSDDSDCNERFVSCPEIDHSLRRQEIYKLSLDQSQKVSIIEKEVTEIPDSEPDCGTESGDPITTTASAEVDFDKYTTKQLKMQLDEWGLKPMKSRKEMINTLRNTLKLIDRKHLLASLSHINANSQSKGGTQSQTQNRLSYRDGDYGDSGVNIIRFSQADLMQNYSEMIEAEESVRVVRKSIFNKIRSVLKADENTYRSILTFRPLSLQNVLDLLVSKDTSTELRLVRECLDELGICYNEIPANERCNQEDEVDI